MKLSEWPFPYNPYMGDSKECQAFMWGPVKILKSVDNTPKWGWLLHVSLSLPLRHPTWNEILAVKEHFFGDEDVMMILPKKEDYVNIHAHCFHLWKTPEHWGIR